MGKLELLSLFSILPPGGMVLFCWRRLELSYKILGFMIIFTMVMEALGSILNINGINNLFLFNVFTWVEGIVLSLFYIFLSDKRRYKLFFYAWALVFILFSVISVIYGEDLDHYNSLQRSIGSIWSVVLCMLFLFEIFQESVIKKLFEYPPFLMTSAFLLYFAGMLFHNLFADYVMSRKMEFDTFIIHSILNIFLNIIYTIVIWMGSRKAILHRQ